jgi:mono/diheme cytochrome c family protein
MSGKSLRRATASACIVGCAFVSFSVPWASALPWDVDMATQQSLKPNEVGRAPVPGTVPMGGRERLRIAVPLDERADALKNPISMSEASVWRGKEIWTANCYTCHGNLTTEKGPVGQFIAVPDVMATKDLRTDGYLFSLIHNGRGNMPRYGYKLSIDDHWHVVNYLRYLQGRPVPGREKF